VNRNIHRVRRVTRSRFLLTALIAATPIAMAPANLAGAAEVGPGYDIEMSRMIPTRDGTELSGPWQHGMPRP
jgi:hypothetical protein